MMIFGQLGPDAQLRTARECRPSGLPCPMTLEEARSHIGQSVLYSAVGAEAEDAVIAHVTRSYVFVRCRRDDRFTSARPGDLTMPAKLGAGAPGKPGAW
jgi:hypothetical protein